MGSAMSFKVLSALAVIAVLASPFVHTADREADLLITGGQVYTLNTGQPWVEAIAVADDEIIHGARVTHTIANGQLVFSEGEKH